MKRVLDRGVYFTLTVTTVIKKNYYVCMGKVVGFFHPEDLAKIKLKVVDRKT